MTLRSRALCDAGHVVSPCESELLARPSALEVAEIIAGRPRAHARFGGRGRVLKRGIDLAKVKGEP